MEGINEGSEVADWEEYSERNPSMLERLKMIQPLVFAEFEEGADSSRWLVGRKKNESPQS
jgi:hypothetical protein